MLKKSPVPKISQSIWLPEYVAQQKKQDFMCGAVANTLPIYIQSIFGYTKSHSFTFHSLHRIMSICSVVEHLWATIAVLLFDSKSVDTKLHWKKNKQDTFLWVCFILEHHTTSALTWILRDIWNLAMIADVPLWVPPKTVQQTSQTYTWGEKKQMYITSHIPVDGTNQTQHFQHPEQTQNKRVMPYGRFQKWWCPKMVGFL